MKKEEELFRAWPSEEFEKLSHPLGGKFWKGPDVVTASDVLLSEKVNYVPVIIGPQHLPPLENPLVSRNLIYDYILTPSTRSRFTQLGIFAEGLVGEDGVGITDEFTDKDWKTLVGGGECAVNYIVINLSKRPIFLPAGIGLFRYYSWWDAKHLEGEELAGVINTREIFIDGEYGHDWFWAHNEEDAIAGVYVRIGEKRFWIPPGEESITVDSESRDYRERIDKVLEPIPKSDEDILWIGQTPRLKLESNIQGVILASLLDFDVPGRRERVWGLHARSLLIDGGFDWPIRVEVYSSTKPEHMPDFVPITFWKDSS